MEKRKAFSCPSRLMPLKNGMDQNKTTSLIPSCLNFEAPNKLSPKFALSSGLSFCVRVYMHKRQLDKNIKGQTNCGGFGTDCILMAQCTNLHIINTFIMSYPWHKASGKINLSQFSVVAMDLNTHSGVCA